MQAEARHDLGEQTSWNHVLTELTNMTEHRRLRELQKQLKTPQHLVARPDCRRSADYLVLVFIRHRQFQTSHPSGILALSFLLALALVAIADIDRPFRGAVHVNPLGFEHALEILSRGQKKDSNDAAYM